LVAVAVSVTLFKDLQLLLVLVKAVLAAHKEHKELRAQLEQEYKAHKDRLDLVVERKVHKEQQVPKVYRDLQAVEHKEYKVPKENLVLKVSLEHH
jgi:cell division protein FtsX